MQQRCNPTDPAKTSMTSLQGYINTTYDILVQLYGEPNCEATDKTDWEWCLETPAGVATIYNYKSGPAYGINTEPQDIEEWHIGGRSGDVVDQVKADIFSFLHPNLKKLTLEEWRNTHIDEKCYIDGIEHIITMVNGEKVFTPVEVDRSVPPVITSDKFIGAWTAGMMQESSETREAVEKEFNKQVRDHEDGFYVVEIKGEKFYVAQNGERGYTAMRPDEY